MVTPYNCTQQVKDVFTRGHCAYLAENLYNRLKDRGWKLAWIGDCDEDWDIPLGNHAVVTSPCGDFFLDINGIQMIEEEVPGKYGDTLYHPESYEEFYWETFDWNYFSYRGLDQPHDQYVNERARKLLKEMGL